MQVSAGPQISTIAFARNTLTARQMRARDCEFSSVQTMSLASGGSARERERSKACVRDTFKKANENLRNNEFREAYVGYTTVLRMDPRHTKALYNRSTLLKRLGKYRRSIEDLKQLVRLAPKDSGARTRLGYMYYLSRCNGHCEDALEQLQEAITLNPQHAEAYLRRGVTLREIASLSPHGTKAQLALALSDFEMCLKLGKAGKASRKHIVEAMKERVILLIQTNEFEKAKSELNQLEQLLSDVGAEELKKRNVVTDEKIQPGSGGVSSSRGATRNAPVAPGGLDVTLTPADEGGADDAQDPENSTHASTQA